MARTSLSRTCVLAVILVGTTTLGACTTDHDLPSLSGSTSPVQHSLEESAKTYYDCMRDDGIDVELTYNDHGELALVKFTGDHSVIQRDENGAMSLNSVNHPLSDQVVNEIMSDTSRTPALVIDGIDHSDAYTTCLAESGFDPWPSWETLVSPSPAAIALQVQANNTWAACARENGWPNLEDSIMPTDPDDGSWPYIFLPSTMTEDQLRQLLDACPNFDPEKQEQLQDWRQSNPAVSYPDGYLPDPAISFELPGTGPTTDPSSPSDDYEHRERLNQILYEKMDEYNQNATPR